MNDDLLALPDGEFVVGLLCFAQQPCQSVTFFRGHPRALAMICARSITDKVIVQR
jgi:hypothetical protein